MSDPIRLVTPLKDKEIARLRAGDAVLLNGVIYTARDAAHQRLTEAVAAGDPLPFELRDQVLYYVGPSPEPPGRVVGAAGPTTSSRMDPYTPVLLEQGLKGMVGKGQRSREVVRAMAAHGAVYFVAVGGAAALLAGRIRESRVVAYADLGPEAVRRLVVEDFPVIVANDVEGNDLFLTGWKRYRRRSRRGD